ncbi:MAG: EAL domain-containing protein [Rickettsiales bacterium]|nr:EAL domain-containing protein [Rickettsiales bacterium]
MNVSAKSFNLPLCQGERYWLSFYAVQGELPTPIGELLKTHGAKANGEGYVVQTGTQWKKAWEPIYLTLKQMDALASVEAGLSYAEAAPANRQEADCKAPVVLQTIADSLWLGEALLEDRVVCYLQSVHSAKDRIFGYESFARVKMPDGKIIGGLQIMAASKVLGIEYMIDRHLHVEAIRTFAASAFNGFLFVNFFPGFIHRPAVYLEGLSETAKLHGVVSKHVVLDFTNSEKPRDMNHIKSVCEYGRSRGYSVALDDVVSVEVAQRLVAEVKPDFLKIDMHLVRDIGNPNSRETIRVITEMVHAAGGTVIAEGVETEEIFDALKTLDVDLFQGYLFSAPEPVEMALKRSSAAG